MDNFLAELDSSSSVLALNNVNRDETPPLSTFSGGETTPLTNQISSMPDDEILLLPPPIDHISSPEGINKEKDGDKDILTGETRKISAIKSDSLLGKNSDELASVIDSPMKPKNPKQKPNKEDDIVEERPLLGDDVWEAEPGVIQTRSHDLNVINDSNLTLEVASSSDPDINTIIGYPKWNLDYLGDRITYGFIGSEGYYNSDDYDNNDGNVYYLNDSAKNTIRKVIGDLEEIIPVDFQEVSYSLENPPLMVFLGVEIPSSKGNAAYASPPSSYNLTGGDVRLDLDYQDNYSVVAHEIGHALGLKHPGRYESDDFGPFLSASRDNEDMTLMSYYPGEKPLTEYRELDIKALQYLYGSNETQALPPEISIGNVTITEGDRTKRATFKVTLDTRATETVKVGYQTVSDTASSGDDYRYKSGTITFKPGQKTKKIRVPIYGDNFNEGDRGFWVNLTNPSNAEINDGWGYGSIVEDDLTVTPSIKINDVSIKEGDRTKRGTFKVTLDTPATQTVKVNYQTVSDTASSGDDYRYKSGTMTFKPGQKTKKIRVPIYGDNFNEGNRGFWVNLTNPRNAEINDGWGYGSIIEDDLTVTPSIKINDISITEGDYWKNATFKVTLDTRPTQTVKVDYQTIDDTAWSGFDYGYKSGTITFKPGQKTKKIKVPIYGDNYYEGDLEFWVNLSNPRNAEIEDEWGHAWILNDDF